jgi:hypothetical protein
MPPPTNQQTRPPQNTRPSFATIAKKKKTQNPKPKKSQTIHIVKKDHNRKKAKKSK